MHLIILLCLVLVKGEFIIHRGEKPLDKMAMISLTTLHCPNQFRKIAVTLWIGLKLLPHIIPVDIPLTQVKKFEQMLDVINLLLRNGGSEIVG